MSTVAKTSIQIETSQAVAGIKNLNINLKATLGGFEGLEKALAENTAALNQARNATGRYDSAQRKTNNTARQGQSAFAGLKNKIVGLAAAYVSLQSAQKFIQEADNYASTTARLNVMNDGLQTTDELYNKIYQSAQRSRGSFNETANAITKLGIVAGDSFKSNDEIIAFIETFNKAAVVSGSSATEASNAMYQLSQAFASGRLQGDELRSVRENAPMLFKAIQKELEAQYGKNVDFKKPAADGLISPDVIKAAAFKSAGEINKAFESMPLTFSQTMTQAFSKVKVALAPIFKEVSKIINNPGFKNGINSIVNFAIKGIYWVWGAIKKLGSVIGWVIGAFDKWKWAIHGVVAVLAIIKTATMIQATWTAILAAKTAIATFIEGVRTKGLWAQFAAMCAVNQATLIAAAIIVGIIVLILLVIYCLEEVTGAIYVVGAVVWNVVLGIYNFLLSCLDALSDAVWGFIEWFYNAATGGFDSFCSSFLNLLGQLVATALSILKPFLEVWDMVFDTNSVELVTGWQNKARSWGKNENAVTLKKDRFKTSFGADDYRWAYKDAWNTGKKHGAIADKALGMDKVRNALSFLGGNSMSVEDMLKGGVNGIPTDTSLDKMLGTVGDPSSFGNGDDAIKKALGDIADNTAQTAQNTGKEDDYELLRDVMRQRAINRVGNTGGTVKIDMVNNNSLSSKLDINSFLGQLAKTIEEVASTSARAVHN